MRSVTFPVSVIIPSLTSRRDFLRNRCIPAVLENDPAEMFVLVSDGNKDGNAKRNVGAYGATQPFLLFVDDDCVLRPGCISKMLTEIDSHPKVDFVYSDYKKLTYSDATQCKGIPKYPGPFSIDAIKKANYINTTSLIRRAAFPGFDPSIRRLQDWDLWLTMIGRGSVGRYIREYLFELWSIDAGVTEMESFADAYEAIVRKHGK